MGTISQILRMEDKVSPVFKDISKNAFSLINEYKRLDKAQTELVQTAKQIGAEFGKNNTMYKELTKSAGEYANKLNNLVKTGELSDSSNVPWYIRWQQGQEGVTKEVTATEAALKRVGSLMKTVVGVYSIKQLMNMSDQMIQNEARLGIMLNSNNWAGNAESLSGKIYGAAQRSRADYNTMASTVAKLGMQAGDAFGSGDEVIRFAENLSKIFATSGLDASGIQSVMYNLTQSMSTGKLLGNDYRILKMNAPEFIKMLRDTYANGSQQVLDEMVSKGKISAQMLKEAIFKNTDEIQAKFDAMPVTWEQAFTSIKNSTQRLLRPVLKLVSKFATYFYKFTTYIEDNWEKFAPIFKTVLVLIGSIATSLLALKMKQKIGEIAESVINLVSANGALIASLGKVVLLIGVAIAAAKAVSWVTEQITGESLDTFGLITAGIAMVVGTVIEATRPIINAWIFLMNAIGGIFMDGLSGLKNAWMGFLISILEGVEYVAKVIDEKTGSNFAGDSYSGLHRKILEMKAEREQLQKDLTFKGIDYLSPKSITQWTKDGYNLGLGFSKGIDNAFKTDELLGDVLSTDDKGNTAINTTSGDKLLSDEDVQLLLDVATRDYKLNYQQITPEISLTFTGDMNQQVDADYVIEVATQRMVEAVNGDLGVASVNGL